MDTRQCDEHGTSEGVTWDRDLQKLLSSVKALMAG
ncbi:hypothetical protein COLO4_12592 [Corchorus olitorius]|uniref:Uncharacterized protein n=1 Tax=Corchorus olitorius TaxID=93759 RepID=A0A1R3K0C9_9ROSI|nr:hypothetical protein COLO4_12592 [Corchorus olitorius]